MAIYSKKEEKIKYSAAIGAVIVVGLCTRKLYKISMLQALGPASSLIPIASSIRQVTLDSLLPSGRGESLFYPYLLPKVQSLLRPFISINRNSPAAFRSSYEDLKDPPAVFRSSYEDLKEMRKHVTEIRTQLENMKRLLPWVDRYRLWRSSPKVTGYSLVCQHLQRASVEIAKFHQEREKQMKQAYDDLYKFTFERIGQMHPEAQKCTELQPVVSRLEDLLSKSIEFKKNERWNNKMMCLNGIFSIVSATSSVLHGASALSKVGDDEKGLEVLRDAAISYMSYNASNNFDNQVSNYADRACYASEQREDTEILIVKMQAEHPLLRLIPSSDDQDEYLSRVMKSRKQLDALLHKYVVDTIGEFEPCPEY